MYVHESPRHHSIKLTQVLVALIVSTFGLSAVSVAYTAGRQSNIQSPTTIEVAPAR